MVINNSYKQTSMTTGIKKAITFFFIIIAAVASIIAQWQPDILGDGYQMRFIEHPDDYQGKVRSTVIRKTSECDNRKAILYIHGYNDYFFQKEMGDRFADSCYRFYAVDLRKYGRSILPGQKKFDARDLSEYFADIDSAISIIKQDGADSIVMLGHSTGGLISSYYLNNRNDSSIVALILNSPFLEWNFNSFMRDFLIPAVGGIGRLLPGLAFSQGNNSGYSESLLKDHHGEWSYNTDWKVISPEKARAGWLGAITRAQNYLHKKSDIKVPVLLMHSDSSYYSDKWTPEYQHCDVVLNVDDISKYGKRLGNNVTEVTIDDGIHDLVLSRRDVRENAYDSIFSWLRRH